MHDRLVIGLWNGQGGACLQHLHLIIIFVEQADDLDLVVVQSLVDHQVLCSQCEHALHILKLYAVDNELLKLLVEEVVPTRLLVFVQVDLAYWGFAFPPKRHLDHFLQTLI